MESAEINDMREQSLFKGITFSKFKKSDAKKEFIKNLSLSKIEQACYWSAELICAGHILDVWDCIFLFYGKHIHLGNPKFPIYLELKVKAFKEILVEEIITDELKLRNHDKIRKLFCEIICVLCGAKRKHSLDEIKIKKEDVFIKERLKAPSNLFAKEVLLNDDPQELFIVVNELCFSLSESGKNTMDACFWIEWILEYEIKCASKKEKCLCETRSFVTVDNKFRKHIVWLLWDALLKESVKRSPPLINKIICSLLSLFSLRYTSGCPRKRRYLLYCAVAFLTEPAQLDEEIIKDKTMVTNIIGKIDLVYKQIKLNEHKPNTDYLLNQVVKSNFDKTIEKLDKMNHFGETFLPRL